MDAFIGQQIKLAQKNTLEEIHGDSWTDELFGVSSDEAYDTGVRDTEILDARLFLDYLKVAY